MLAITYRTSDTFMHSLETSREKKQKQQKKRECDLHHDCPHPAYSFSWGYTSCKCLRDSCACRERRVHFWWMYFVYMPCNKCIATETWGRKGFTSMLANLNGCQHSRRPSFVEMWLSCQSPRKTQISHLWDKYLSDLPTRSMTFISLQEDFSEIEAVNEGPSSPQSLNSCAPSPVLAISKVPDNIHSTIYSL